MIVPIVEGPGDAEALPLMVRRILYERLERYDVQVASGRQNVVTAGGRGQLKVNIEKFVRHAQRKPGCDSILVLIDTDDECCPVELAEELRSRAGSAGVTRPLQVVCAHHAYEAWFLASIDTIRDYLDLIPQATLMAAPKNQHSPKGWLSANMQNGRSYKPTSHQLALSQRVDLASAYDKSRSFRRLCHAVEQLAAQI